MVYSKEGMHLTARSALLTVAQRAALRQTEVAASGLGHAELTAAAAARTAGQTPVAVGASRTVCLSCQAALTRLGVRF
jgi:hypothetical protein